MLGHIFCFTDAKCFQGAVVCVTSTDEIVIVVRFATAHNIPLAVKGGGYSTSGSSIARGGIVLDLCKLRRVHVDPVSETVVAQGGALWEDIDVAAAQYGLAVVGSTIGQIGAAGSTMGGGFGWLTGQYGLAIDNLLWAQMILSDGRVVTASENLHPDLFWATRGAGQSFGVAVELGFQAHRQAHPVFAGTLSFSAACLPEIIAFANQFESITNGKQALWLEFAMLPSMLQCAIVAVVFYNGTQADAEHFFAPLFSLRPIENSTRILPYDALNGLLHAEDALLCRETRTRCDITRPPPVGSKIGPRKRLRGSNITLPIDFGLIQSIYDEFDGFLRECPQASDSELFIELLPNTRVRQIRNDATAFAGRGPYYNVKSIFRWHGADLDERIHSFQSQIMTRIGAEAGVARLPNYNVEEHGTGLYANYAGKYRTNGCSSLILCGYSANFCTIEHDQPPEALFGSNISRLRELKKTYDSQNTFRKWHNISVPIRDPKEPQDSS